MSWADKYPEQRLVSYDDSWATLYGEYEAHLKACLGRRWEFEHVGSTSVPGLLAKPVIDIAMRMPAELCLSEATRRLLHADWSGPVQVADHWTTVFPAKGVRSAIGHVFTAGQWPEAHLRLFADWLRRHEADRDRYASLKRGLVERGVHRVQGHVRSLGCQPGPRRTWTLSGKRPLVRGCARNRRHRPAPIVELRNPLRVRPITTRALIGMSGVC